MTKLESRVTYWSKAFVSLCIWNMMIFFAFQMLLPNLPLILAESGREDTFVGIITGLITLSAVIVRPFTGYAIDNLNRRIVVLIGNVLFAISAIAYIVSGATIWVILASILLGMGWGMMTVILGSLVADRIPSVHQGKGFGAFMAFGFVSMAIAPLTGQWLFNTFGSSVLYISAFGIALFPIALIPFLSFSKPIQHLMEKGGRTSFLHGIYEKTSLFPSMLLLLFTISYGGIISFANLFGTELGMVNAGWFFLLFSVSSILIRPWAGKRFDTKGHSSVIIPGILIGIVSLILLSLSSGKILFLAAAILYGLSFGAIQPSIMAWTVGRASPERRGAANSTFLVGMDGGLTLGSILLGVLSQQVGYASMYMYSSIALVAMLILYGNSLFARRTGKMKM